MSSSKPIRVFVVEDNEETRNTIVGLINAAPSLECAGTSASGEEALLKIPPADPDVVLMDILLPGISGIECVRLLRVDRPRQLVIMLTAFQDDELIFNALAAGATGYLLKQAPACDVVAGILEVHQGGAPMSSGIARRVLQSFHRPPPPRHATHSLTAREAEILGLLAQGGSYKEIAARLAQKYSAIDYHIRGIYEKLHVHSRGAAVAKYHRL